MKLATGLIALMLGLLVLLQSCTVASGGGLMKDQAVYEAGSVGLFVALTYLVGGAFAFGLPLVAMIVFLLGAGMAFLVVGDFPDMSIWGTGALVLAAMAYAGRRMDAKKRAAGTAGAEKQS